MRRVPRNAEPKFLELDHRLVDQGLRMTSQRREVYAALVQELDHPTAQEVFLKVKQRMPEISLATVYNCLETLVKCGLLRRVDVDSVAGRFCPNMSEHGHFYCETCGKVYDIALDVRRAGSPAVLPHGFTATRYDIAVRGLCACCQGGLEASPGSEKEL